MPSNTFREILNSFSLSGAIVLILALFTFTGIIMCMFGIKEGVEIYKNFATAFTTFISAKAIDKLEK